MTAPNKNEGLIAELNDLSAKMLIWPIDRTKVLKAARAIQDLEASLSKMEACLLNISLMDCYTRDGEEPAHELMMRLAKECLASTARWLEFIPAPRGASIPIQPADTLADNH